MTPLTGRALWTLLHGYALAWPDTPPSDEMRAHALEWLAVFDSAVEAASVGRCPCHHHWQGIRAAHPPDLTDRASFYWWTVRVHDEVNAKLNKPRLHPAA